GAWRVFVPVVLSVGLAVGAILAEKALESWKDDRTLREAVEEARKGVRWSAVEAPLAENAVERAQALALFRRDLPAFSALDGLTDPGRRFWARCVEGSRLLAAVAGDQGP